MVVRHFPSRAGPIRSSPGILPGQSLTMIHEESSQTNDNLAELEQHAFPAPAAPLRTRPRTVIDRLVQQAILQVLEPLLGPSFSASSFSFRPGRGAHQALHRARKYDDPATPSGPLRRLDPNLKCSF